MTFFDVMTAAGDAIIAVLWFVVKFIGCLALTAVELIVMIITVMALIRFCVWLNGEMMNWWKERNDANRFD